MCSRDMDMICRDVEMAEAGQRTDEVAPVAIRRLLESWTPSAGSGLRLAKHRKQSKQRQKHRKQRRTKKEKKKKEKKTVRLRS